MSKGVWQMHDTDTVPYEVEKQNFMNNLGGYLGQVSDIANDYYKWIGYNSSGFADMFTGGASTQKAVGALNSAMSIENMEYQRALQERIFQREDNAYQRTVADLKKAGLSPIMAATASKDGAGSSVGHQAPTAHSASTGAGFASFIQNAVGIASSLMQVSKDFKQLGINEGIYNHNMEWAQGHDLPYGMMASPPVTFANYLNGGLSGARKETASWLRSFVGSKHDANTVHSSPRFGLNFSFDKLASAAESGNVVQAVKILLGDYQDSIKETSGWMNERYRAYEDDQRKLGVNPYPDPFSMV